MEQLDPIAVVRRMCHVFAVDTPGGTVAGLQREVRERAKRAAALALAQQRMNRAALVTRRDLANQAANLHDRNQKHALEDAGRHMAEGRRLARALETAGEWQAVAVVRADEPERNHDHGELIAAMERVFMELVEAQQRAVQSERLAAAARDYASGVTRQIGKLPKSARPQRRAARKAALGHQAFRPRKELPSLPNAA